MNSKLNFKMKRLQAFLIVLILSAGTALAQPGSRMEEKKDKIEAMKVGFLTQRLDLTSEEAKNFWPVYNQYQKDLDNLRSKRRGDRRDAKQEFEAMNDKDVEKVVDDEIVFRQNELDIMKRYHTQFKQVLPIKKVAKLYRSEEDFKRELLQKIKERKEMKQDR